MGLADKILSTDWLNENSLRNYPLADDATGLDTTGSFTLPKDLLVDAIFPVDTSLNLDPGGFHV